MEGDVPRQWKEKDAPKLCRLAHRGRVCRSFSTTGDSLRDLRSGRRGTTGPFSSVPSRAISQSSGPSARLRKPIEGVKRRLPIEESRLCLTWRSISSVFLFVLFCRDRARKQGGSRITGPNHDPGISLFGYTRTALRSLIQMLLDSA